MVKQSMNSLLEETLEKRLYIYRRSFKDYQALHTGLIIVECMSAGAALSAIAIPPLAAIAPIGIALIEGVKKSQNIPERKQEYKIAYKFYKELLNLYKAGEISESDVYLKEKEFIGNLEFFPREKYLREMHLNGY